MIVVQQGDDNDRAGMHDVFSAGALPIWQSDDVAPCLKEASVEQRLAFKQGFDQVRVGGFGHEGSAKNGYLRSEEHTSELQSLMRISYAVFCLKKKKTLNTVQTTETHSTINT